MTVGNIKKFFPLNRIKLPKHNTDHNIQSQQPISLQQVYKFVNPDNRKLMHHCSFEYDLQSVGLLKNSII